jgi:hypothetical protein
LIIPSSILSLQWEKSREPRPLLHRNRQPAQIDIDLQPDLLAGEPKPRALLVLQHEDLPAAEHSSAAAERDIGAADVVGTGDVAHRAVEAGARGAEHQPGAEAPDRDRIDVVVKKQRAVAARRADEPAALDDREADGALSGGRRAARGKSREQRQGERSRAQSG